MNPLIGNLIFIGSTLLILIAITVTITLVVRHIVKADPDMLEEGNPTADVPDYFHTKEE